MEVEPRAILFDLDGTLYDRDAAVRKVVEVQHARFGDALAHIAQPAYIERMMELDAHGHVERKIVYGTAAREFGLPAEMVPELISHYWETFGPFCECFLEVPATLEHLRARGIKLGIITNGTIQAQEMKIRHLKLGPLINETVIAEREGIGKPDRRIFERALKRLGVSARDAWFVGDHPDADIRGAFEAGLAPVWRCTVHWPRPVAPCREIRALDELIGFLPPR